MLPRHRTFHVAQVLLVFSLISRLNKIYLQERVFSFVILLHVVGFVDRFNQDLLVRFVFLSVLPTAGNLSLSKEVCHVPGSSIIAR